MTASTIDPAALVARIRERVWNECDPAKIVAAGADEAPRIVAALADGFMHEEALDVAPSLHAQVIEGVVAATLGLGPLQSLLADPDVSEIMVNGCDAVYVERAGEIERLDVRFDDEAHLRQLVDRILAPIGRRVDAMAPMVDARLADGSRVNVAIPPLAIDGTVLTIRRFVQVAVTLDDLVRLDSLESIGALELERLVANRDNVLVAGGTSTGKTTLLAASLAAAAMGDRLIVLEDSSELPLVHPHCVRLEARCASTDGVAEVTMRDLVRNALRMRPDRIIVGEVRGAEAYDLLQALNTGHRGSWSTIHANGAHESLLRLESMVLSAASGMPQPVVREQVARSVDAVVHIERCGAVRRVASIHRVSVVDEQGGGGWQLAPVYVRGD